MEKQKQSAESGNSPAEATATSDRAWGVYRADDATGCRLVLTPLMLLDALKECQDDAALLHCQIQQSGAGLERRHGLLVNPLADRVDKLHGTVSHLLRLLWRDGIWTDGEIVAQVGTDGKAYHALREPFTDGKPGGRPLAADAPLWLREMLGVPVSQRTLDAALARADANERELEAVR